MTIVDSQSKILSNEWVNNEYKHMVVYVGEKAASVEPGQFFNLLCPQTESDKPYFRRPMSTYFANPKTGQVEFLYKVTGSGTRTLAMMQAEQQLPVLGPLGKGFTLKPEYKHILVLGRGVGLATLAPLAESAAEKGIKVTAILSARDQHSIMSQHRFSATGASVIEVIDSNKSSDVENVKNIILTRHKSSPFDAVFTCGSTRLTHLLQDLVNQLNIEGEVALEQQMACGIGMCYCCIKPFKEEGESEPKSKRVCIDGPVFNIKEVIL
ncbi:dihydroorotate dehydrogenase electron transfer subunit [Zophobihabitans entericus]|uniref:Dihydroorotate dehydrogenase electron transfer subunit n=1 Tax=Zophobihabitans entericus TaxID=1635327 RepID=A0A6G9IBU1_9GAMM|nr:dihydroorotate dehydrogenase electron transfer subunit [Zophobihabitans entericus]QIQ21184.1 dihydroorotate dehydrogenase electron transfer subunit [Zophobihabitans entericus]